MELSRLDNGLWLVPSYRRPQRLQKLLASIVEHGAKTKGMVLLTAGDGNDYSNLKVPDGWGVVELQEGAEGRNAILNQYFKDFPTLGWYGLLEDDMVVRTPGWDVALVNGCPPYGFSTANDKWLAPNRARGAKVLDGDLVRAMGCIAPPGTKHSFLHEMHEDIGANFKCWAYLPDIVVEEEHVNNGKAPGDDGYVRTASWLSADQEAFNAHNNERRLDIFRTLGEKTGKIVRVAKFDGLHVAIATPCHGNKVEINYLHSVVAMTHMLRTHNAQFSLLTVPNEALVMRSRNHLVWQFMQTDCTHLFFADSDMGWKAGTILRLLSHGKDIVAGIGRRKQEGPPSYCANLVEPVHVDKETGLIKAIHVGGACLLLSRACIVKMLAAYDQLKYLDVQANRYETALFDTEIRDGKFWSEDYTFCRRARDIGFDVWIDPEIYLEHVGFTSWNGSMADDLFRKPAELAAQRQVVAAPPAPVAEENVAAVDDVAWEAAAAD